MPRAYELKELINGDHHEYRPHIYINHWLTCFQTLVFAMGRLSLSEADEDAEALSNKFPPHKGPVKITNVLATINFMMRAL